MRASFNILIALVLSCTLSGCGSKNAKDSPEPAKKPSVKRASPDAIVEEVKRCIAERDIEILVNLGHWDGVPDKYPDVIRKHMTDIFDFESPTFEIIEMTEEEKKDSKIGERHFSWNIKAVSWLKISSGKQGSKIPLGVHEGQYYVATKVEK